MSDITITKTAGAGSGVSYTIRNICTLDIELCTLVSDFPIPETGASQRNNFLFQVESYFLCQSPVSCDYLAASFSNIASELTGAQTDVSAQAPPLSRVRFNDLLFSPPEHH